MIAGIDKRALLLKQRHEVALQIDKIDGFIHNEASPDEGKAADCLKTFTDTVSRSISALVDSFLLTGSVRRDVDRRTRFL